MKEKKSYQENFRTAVKMLMAKEDELDTLQKVADHLEIGYMALYKVMDGTNNPTTELCIRLCVKEGYSANWMFLGKGEMLQQVDQSMQDLTKEVRSLRAVIQSHPEFSTLSKVNTKVNSRSKIGGKTARAKS